MKWETNILRTIPKTDGTLTDETGNTVEVRFTLTETQDFVDGVPTQNSLRYCKRSAERTFH